jgi:hypothetical protein
MFRKAIIQRINTRRKKVSKCNHVMGDGMQGGEDKQGQGEGDDSLLKASYSANRGSKRCSKETRDAGPGGEQG